MWQKFAVAVWAGLTRFAKAAFPILLKISVAGMIAFFMLFMDGVDLLLQSVWDELPAEMQADLSPYLQYLAWANAWVPIKEFIVAAVGVYTFLGTFITVKLFIKIFLPTLG